MALAGCGSSAKIATSADPASAVPASAALYAGANVRPQGKRATEALAAGVALTNQADPYLRLLAALQTPGSPTLDYKRDVAPWLGPHAGVFLTSLNAAGLAHRDRSNAGCSANPRPPAPSRSAPAQPTARSCSTPATTPRPAPSSTARPATRARTRPATAASPTGSTAPAIAFGIVERFAVIGSEAGLHAVIDTTLGGPALAPRRRLLEAARRRPHRSARARLLQPRPPPTQRPSPARAPRRHLRRARAALSRTRGRTSR